MRRWGVVVSAFYALMVLVLIIPAAVYVAGDMTAGRFLKSVEATYEVGECWVIILIVLSGQALLLFLSVDTSWRRQKPRAHIAISCTIAGVLTALLAFSVLLSVTVAVRGDKFFENLNDDNQTVSHFFLLLAILWVVWGIVFYLFLRKSSDGVNRIVSWLLRGSVLELLIVVPSHIIVRRRQDCSAPMVTSFGIATGLAIMLLSFGPSVLFLYKKRLDEY